MGYEVSWYQEKRIIKVRLFGETSIEELRKMSADITACLQEGIAPVHSLADITEFKKYPTNVVAIRSVVQHLSHPNHGLVSAVGGPALAQSFLRIMSNLFSINYRLFRTTDEALQFLSQKDKTL